MKYSDAQWNLLVKEMKELGMKYLVMCNVASNGWSIYDSKVLPKIAMASADPLEAVMKAADQYDIKIFLTNDFFKDNLYYKVKEMFYPENVKSRYRIMEEVAEKYSTHKSFYGWYWAWESFLSPYFPDYFIKYVNDTTTEAKSLTPDAKILLAPYGTRSAKYDDQYIKQVESLDVDFIAYQDTVGCYAMDTVQSKRAFETLRKVHDKVPQRKLWADVETFTWEGIPNTVDTPLIPATFDRLKSQLAAVSPYVDEVLVFIFEGLFSNPDSPTFTGYAEAARYYNEYAAWLKEKHPDMVKSIK